MKRMSEVLVRELPISKEELLHVIVNETTAEDDEAIAHAINHVDALADALGDIVFDYFATINLSNVDMASLNPKLHKKMTVATDALSAYRGGK